MVDVGPVYLTISGALLLVALALGLRVLRGIVREGRDRRRRRRAGEIEKYTEDEEYGRRPRVGPDGDSGEADGPTRPDDRSEPGGPNAPDVTCPGCGAVNAPGFTYCRRCAGPLRSET
ncbi:DUF7577 domain-containing protein [Halorubrum sp. HHNYT27]|uniref:DUF7577 domain-containing protein n=1 Tax=Halorubrum sp. HHNYT27 TaxID=3402275 RepID=UPI003EB7AC9D